MFHAYTYGKDSKQFMILTPTQADLLDRFTDAFQLAQEEFLKEHGRHWTPDEPLMFPFSKTFTQEDLDTYNALTYRLNRQHKIRNKIFNLLRIDCRDEEFDTYLLKRI